MCGLVASQRLSASYGIALNERFKPMSEPQSLDESQARVLSLFREKESFLLSGHVRPDGDCIGGEAALASVLLAMGKRVTILNPDPPDPNFAFFTDALDFGVYQEGELPQHDVAVLLDISELSRCGALGDKIGAADSIKVVIDHHMHFGEEWWDASFVDVTASATGLLVYRIARALGVELDRTAADAVYVSLVCDTGWFKYSNTDAETLTIAGDLVGRGVEPSKVYDALFQRDSPSQPLWLSGMLSTAVYHAEGKLVMFELPFADPIVTKQADSDPAMDVLRAVEGVEVVLFLRELEGDQCKLSARSKTDYDVNALARKFGGGGHQKASGATIEGSLSSVRERMLAAALEGFSASVGPSS